MSVTVILEAALDNLAKSQPKTPKKMTRKEIVAKTLLTVASSFLAMMEKGIAPWRPGWTNGSGTMKAPVSIHGHLYRKLNRLVLMLAQMQHGYTSNRWAAMGTICKRGGKVRKGEKGTPIVSWFKVKVTDDEGKEVLDRNGRAKTYLACKVQHVWNLEQISGFENLVPEPVKTEAGPVENLADSGQALEAIVKGMEADGLTVAFNGASPHYRPSSDSIGMPKFEAWKSADEMGHTLLHELAHATGSKKRLKRDGVVNNDGFGSHQYGLEEFIAELTAETVAQMLDIATPETTENSAAYIKSWAKTIKEDPSILWTLTKQIEAASAYLIERGNIAAADLVDLEPEAVEAVEAVEAPKAKTKTFTFHTDAGHGWLKVTAKDLAAVGLEASNFSRFSYTKQGKRSRFFYLEEDCDAGLFVTAYEAKHGCRPSFKVSHTDGNSFIRSLPGILTAASLESGRNPRSCTSTPAEQQRVDDKPQDGKVYSLSELSKTKSWAASEVTALDELPPIVSDAELFGVA